MVEGRGQSVIIWIKNVTTLWFRGVEVCSFCLFGFHAIRAVYIQHVAMTMFTISWS